MFCPLLKRFSARGKGFTVTSRGTRSQPKLPPWGELRAQYFHQFRCGDARQFAVSAAELTPLPIDLPPSFSDDVDGGDFQERQANLPCGADTLKATLRIDSLHIDKRWASSLRIGLYEEGKRNEGNRDFSKRYVSLILGLVDEGGPLKFELNKKEGRDVLQRMTFSVHEALSRTFPVEAIWTADGTINFSIGGQPLKPITLATRPRPLHS
jgi:hypothetical protein